LLIVFPAPSLALFRFGMCSRENSESKHWKRDQERRKLEWLHKLPRYGYSSLPCLSVVVGLNEILDRYVKRMWTLWNFFFRCVFAEGLNVCRLVAVRCVNIVWEILAHYPLQEWMFSVNTEWSWELFMLKRRCRPGKQNASKGWV